MRSGIIRFEGVREDLVRDLICGVRLYNGDETACYLFKGFNVVGIEANPMLATQPRCRFEKEIAAARLTFANVGIAASEGTLSFWVTDYPRL